jgi:hypothetical protein
MTKGLPIFYAVVAVVCLAAPYITAAPAVATALFPYTSGPFALVSLALGLAASLRRGPLWLELIVAALWGAGAIALSLQLSAPPAEFEALLALFRLQMLLSGLAAVGLLLAVLQVCRQAGRPISAVVQTLALLGVAGLLARRSLIGLGVVPANGGIEAVSAELRLAQLVLMGCGSLILMVGVALRLREQRSCRAVQQ